MVWVNTWCKVALRLHQQPRHRVERDLDRSIDSAMNHSDNARFTSIPSRKRAQRTMIAFIRHNASINTKILYSTSMTFKYVLREN